MFRFRKTIAPVAAVLTLTLAMALAPAPQIKASDHGDAPINSNDQAIDQGDTYAFLDPNDNSKVIIALTVRGFIVPGEAVNFGFFDSRVRYRFEIETTGDARPDQSINITFPERTSPTTPQMATVELPFGQVFTAPTTLPTLAGTPNPPTITTDAASGVAFFAGEVDDPFFFDIPGFARFRASVLAGAPDPTQFNRGRDSFSGYNILAIALSIPASLFRLQRTSGNPDANVIGVQSLTQRREETIITRAGIVGVGKFRTLDRSGNPGLNALVIPFGRKDEYNFATPLDDSRGQFAGDIVATLGALGTNATNIGILASVYVARGDYLRLNISVPNTGTGGGSNPEAAFPNGRRLGDDIVDTFLFFVANQNVLRDNVNSNDVPFRDTFPFLAPPQQPRASGDDNTRN